MHVKAQGTVTGYLAAWGAGDGTAIEALVPLVQSALERIARHHMRRERAGHTLQTTALVNEAYLRLLDLDGLQWVDRRHFYAIAARVMRRVLVDHARRRNFKKRGGGAIAIELTDIAVERPPDLVALDDALRTLAGKDDRKSRVVELRYFAGLSVEETAETLGISVSTVMREWRLARAWLHAELEDGGTRA